LDELLQELDQFLDRELPTHESKWGDQLDSWDARCAWQRVMADNGWAAPAWPAEHGGRGADIMTQLAIEERLSARGIIQRPGVLGLNNVGPTLIAYGTEEQKQSLPRILNTDEMWCQGFSEPGAGSDLAGLRTRAVRDGEDFVVNGQKVWTSNGMHATHMECLVRTDPDAPKHAGISVLLLDMTTPGVEVRPIKQINGNAEFAEVFFTDVRVPVENLLGPLNQGWTVTRTTLGHERAGVATMAAHLEREATELVRAQAARPADDRPRAADVDRLLASYVETKIVGRLSAQALSSLARGEQPGAEQSVIKLAWSEAGQRLAAARLALAGYSGVAGEPALASAQGYLSARSSTIAAGTSQIVRNVLAERVLGLPRE
jgi:alkylation response protein AidB-like acyl-CoA dehydrogenase